MTLDELIVFIILKNQPLEVKTVNNKPLYNSL